MGDESIDRTSNFFKRKPLFMSETAGVGGCRGIAREVVEGVQGGQGCRR